MACNTLNVNRLGFCGARHRLIAARPGSAAKLQMPYGIPLPCAIAAAPFAVLKGCGEGPGVLQAKLVLPRTRQYHGGRTDSVHSAHSCPPPGSLCFTALVDPPFLSDPGFPSELLACQDSCWEDATQGIRGLKLWQGAHPSQMSVRRSSTRIVLRGVHLAVHKHSTARQHSGSRQPCSEAAAGTASKAAPTGAPESGW